MNVATLSHLPTWVVTTATFAFGVVPATLLVMFALMMGAGAIVALFHPETAVFWRVALAVPVVPASIFGYAALFRAAREQIDAKGAIGLSAGVVANGYGVYLVVTDLNPTALDSVGGWYLFCGPIVVALLHLIGFAFRKTDGRRVPSA